MALDLPGPLDVRWYGLGYLLGFAIAYILLRRFAREGWLRLSEEAAGDLISALALGVILGGRLGYIIFYDFAEFAAHPLRIFRVWEGGLSFHGGLLGVLIVAALYVRRHRVSFLNLTDAFALCIPFGIFAVRVANFINGELYGRVTDASVPWAMRFPTDPVALRVLGAEGLPMRQREQVIEQAFEDGTWAQLQGGVPLRHPSPLYEALTEGLLLGLILWGVYAWARRRGKQPPEGTYGGIFLLGYGLFRSLAELFRQPDVQFRGPGDPLGTVLGPLTMGQSLSAVMIIGGLGLLIYAGRGRDRIPG